MRIVKFVIFFIAFIFIILGDIIIFSMLQVYKLFFSSSKRLNKVIKKTQKNINNKKKEIVFNFSWFLMRIKRNLYKTDKFFIRKESSYLFKNNQNIRKSKLNSRTRRSYYVSGFFSKLKYFLFGIFFSFCFIFLPLVAFIFASDLPNPYNLSTSSIPKTTKIYDRNDNLLYEIYANQNRTIVKLSDVPFFLQQATIAIEDKDFYSHPGFDLRGIIRALLSNIKNQSLQGGSTITQQLIKAAFLSPEPTVMRKIKEVALAFLAERVYSKNKILELYFNYVPYGGTAWGVGSASEIYFGKNVQDLDLAECSFLAGMPKAPSIYSPYNGTNNTLWKTRQKEVLSAMVKQKYITQEAADQAYQEKLVFQDPNIPIRAPHFVFYIKDLLIQKYGITEVERGGLRVKTSLDLSLQQTAEKIVRDEVENDNYLSIKNGAALITNPQNGDVLAMVGNYNYYDKDNGGNVNIATSLRQPGSSIKIVTYSLALSSGFTEATILDDSPLSIKLSDGTVYSPVNYDGSFHGKVPIRFAFANSLNIPAVRVAEKLGVSEIVNFGQKMGITSWDNSSKYGLSITLGAADTTMLDMATIYGTIANSGKRVNLDPVLEIKDVEGKIIYEKQPEIKQVVDPGVAFIVSDILADNNARSMEFGLNSPLKIDNHRVSVKTGTSDNKRDNWTIGFTKDFVVTTWVGNNDNSPMSQTLASGITGAAPIWNKIMTGLLQNRVDSQAIIPSDIIKKFCLGHDAYFLRGTENNVSCGFNLTPTVSPTLFPYPSVFQMITPILSQPVQANQSPQNIHKKQKQPNQNLGFNN